MTVEHGSSLDSTETAIDSMETPPADEDGGPPACQGLARVSGLAVIRRWIHRCLARWPSIVATVLVVTAVGLAAGLFFILHRPDQQIDDAAAHRAIGAASDGAVAVLSYSPDNLDHDFAKAKSHLTGDFLAYYNKFTEQLVTPMAQQKHITQAAKVVRAAVLELHPDSAAVLVFLNQTATSKDKPEPLITPISVRVMLTKVSDSWLISNLDPLS
jgi:Mce-associated membrane protein